MALLAGDFGVETGQRVARSRVIELFCGFPVFDVVAFRAIVAELTLVRIGMAGRARGRLAEEGIRGIGVFDQRFARGKHVRRGVALLTGYGRVLAFEGVTGEAMVEVLLRRLPVNQAEIFAVVLQVATHTIFAIGILHLQAESGNRACRRGPRQLLCGNRDI